MTRRRIGVAAASLALVVGLAPMGSARSGDAHMAGMGATAWGTCAAVIDVHATELDHPGQYLDLYMLCGPVLTEVHFPAPPDCIEQVGNIVYLAYEGPQVRLAIEDGGMASDSAAVAVGPFKRAKPTNKCRAEKLTRTQAVGDFTAGLP